jgi:hypothetical protein
LNTLMISLAILNRHLHKSELDFCFAASEYLVLICRNSG